MSQKLGVTRAAIWKAIKSLQQAGYPIEAVTNRGYRLTGPADVLSAYEIREALQTESLSALVREIHFEKTVDSTNMEAKRSAEKSVPDGTLFVAERQNTGRGRRGRTWVSDHQQGLWFSLLLRPQANPAEMSRITLFAGLCTALALQRMTGKPVGIKWPNDVVSETCGRKLAGILTEMIIEENVVSAVIIGIGTNVNNREFPAELADIASSLHMESGQTFRRVDVLAAILDEFAIRYPAFLSGETWLDEYRQRCLTLGRQVRVTDAAGKTLDGLAVDLDPAGELIVETPDGARQTVFSGEVSVRGLLGYL